MDEINNLISLEKKTDSSINASNQPGCSIYSSDASTMPSGGNQPLENKGNNFPKSAKTLRSPNLNVRRCTLQVEKTAGTATASPVTLFAKDIVSNEKGTSLSEQMPSASTNIINSEDLLNKFQKMEKLIAQLSNEVAELKRENSTLKEKVKNSKAEDSARINNLSSNHIRPSTSQHDHSNNSNWLLRQFPVIQQNNRFNALTLEDYFTDEEELEKEVSSADNRNTKKRRRTKTKTPPKNTTQSVNNNTEEKSLKIPMPPPINVSNIKNFEHFRQKVIKNTSESTNFKALSNSDIKITFQNENDYRNVKKLLEELKNEPSKELEKNIEYHTYQLKSEKAYRVVIRGLPSSISHDEIKADLEKMGHEVAGITNIFKMVTINGAKVRKHFPLFYIDLKQKDNNKEVYNIKKLAYCIVKIEPPNKTRGIPQCTNCQQLGHTKSFCHRQTKCVKCAEDHHTTKCQKQKDTPPSCALCQQQGHTANYKGCRVYQNKIKSQQNNRTSVVQRLQTKVAKPQTTITPCTVGLSYAQITKSSADESNQNNKLIEVNNESNNSEIIKILSKIQQLLGHLAERVAKLETNSYPPSKKSQHTHK